MSLLSHSKPNRFFDLPPPTTLSFKNSCLEVIFVWKGDAGDIIKYLKMFFISRYIQKLFIWSFLV